MIIMRRRKPKTIKLNDLPALENLLQEVYTDATNQITEVSEIILQLDTMAQPSDVDDLTKIVKEKTNALKLKDSATRIKIDVSKMMREVMKDSGEGTESTVISNNSNVEFSDNDAFDQIRKLIEEEEKNKK